LSVKGHSALKVPWLRIARSLPVWAVCIAHFTNNWGYYTLLTCLPMYLKSIMHFDMKSVSITVILEADVASGTKFLASASYHPASASASSLVVPMA